MDSTFEMLRMLLTGEWVGTGNIWVNLAIAALLFAVDAWLERSL